MQDILTVIIDTVKAFGLELLTNPAFQAAVAVWLLSVVPGPLKPFVGSITKWMLEQAAKLLEERKLKVAETAVKAAEQAPGLKAPQQISKQTVNEQKRDFAVDLVMRKTGADSHEAKAIVEASVKRMNELEKILAKN